MITRPWSIGLAVAIAAHGVIAAALIVTHTLVPPPKPAGAAILLDLPPVAPPAPAKAPEPQPQPKPQPVVKKLRPAAPKPSPRQAVALPQAAPEPPAAESAAAAPAEPAPASTQQIAPPSPDPHAVSSWQSRLLAHLERHKRFPSQAQARRLRGTALVAFSLDRSGRVLTQAINTSSGHASLDAAALDMLVRAQPLPPPPPEIHGAVLQLTVPVRFFLN